MIIVLKRDTSIEDKNALVKEIQDMGLEVKDASSTEHMVFGLIGDVSRVDIQMMQAHRIVEKVTRVQAPFKLASREFNDTTTVVDVMGTKVGGGNMTIIAGPCSVESEEQLMIIARAVKASGATMLRGGAFKPRTSPYSFQGLGEEGLKLLKKASKETGLPIVTEVMSTDDFDLVAKYADVLQIGARNMQNFSLLKKAGETKKPILLKRGMSATIQDLLMSAEYILAGGNPNVILCERGIRTFEKYTRNTLDLAVVSAIKELSHLPIIIDPSHATGRWEMVEPASKAAIAAGADGLMVEVHHDPERAMSDGQQSLKPQRFDALVKACTKIHEVITC